MLHQSKKPHQQATRDTSPIPVRSTITHILAVINTASGATERMLG
jgi:hypothetical protein